MVDKQETDLYQLGGNAWSPDRPDLLELLSTAEHTASQPIYYGSNHTFLVTLDGGAAGESFAVYKPARGEYPLYDFPNGTLYRREIATWLVDCLLGWGVVPPTVEAQGRHGVGSLQLFIDAAASAEVEVDELRPVALLDVLINNADRKSEHFLPGIDGRIWGIDHGLTFHSQPKLRTVLWHFAGLPLLPEERADLERLRTALWKRTDPCAGQLADLVSKTEWRALLDRLNRLLDSGRFPDPRYRPVPYRW
jgi:hypothetical protein